MNFLGTSLLRLKDALNNADGESLASLLDVWPSQGQIPVTELRKIANFERFCAGKVTTPFDTLYASHLATVRAMEDGNAVEAFSHQSIVTGYIHKLLEDNTNWILPCLHVVNRNLRVIAEKADDQTPGSTGTRLGEAENMIKKSFQVCITDRSPLDVSKKWGTLAVVGQLFKIYFRMNNLRMCKNPIRSIEHPNFPNLDAFPKSHAVTYKFFVGRLAMFEDDDKRAIEHFSYAFRNCHSKYTKHKSVILQYLVPLNMLRGRLPRPTLLQRYSLQQFESMREAVKRGDLKLFNESLEKHQEFFIRKGIYLMLEKLKIIVYRNLFKKIFLIVKKAKMPLSTYETCLHFLGLAMDLDEIECVFANLIHQGFVKGYLSHEKRYLVLSAKNPFPSIASIVNT